MPAPAPAGGREVLGGATVNTILGFTEKFAEGEIGVRDINVDQAALTREPQ